uniref:Fibroleukin n=1 Tax=Ascaris suum TaxID=6253 RepID=F1KV55_ASCSU
MREYNNRDVKSNEAELDPCIAAEVRMKKGLFSPRIRRSLLAAFVITILIILLSVLLFLLLSRSREESRPTIAAAPAIADYDQFEPVVQTSTSPRTTPAITTQSSAQRSHHAAVVESQSESDGRPEMSWPKESVSEEDTQSSYTEKLFTISAAPVVFPWLSDGTTTSTPIPTQSLTDGSANKTDGRHTSSLQLEDRTVATEAATPAVTPSTELVTPQKVLEPVVSQNDSSSPRDCKTLLEEGKRTSGVYRLWLPKVGSFDAFCDMTTNGGGWTVVQRREDASVYFSNRTWHEYEEGFGHLSTSFWLGLRKIHALVAKERGRSLILRIELNGDFCNDGDRCSQMPDGFWWGEWEFKVSDASHNYMLTISPAIAGNLTERTNMDKFFYMNNGKPFTAIDKDNDRLSGNCAQFRDFGGWWHNDCGYVALNGRYGDTSSKMRNAFFFYSRGSRPTVSYYIKPKFTKMMLRSRS